MKTNKIIYWVSTSIVFLFDGLMPAFYGGSEQSIQGIAHLGYPDYFRVLLTIFKVAGGIILILPLFKGRIKEWAYAGFTFDFIFAAASHNVVDGFGMLTIFPLIILAILCVSYIYYHRIRKEAKNNFSHHKINVA